MIREFCAMFSDKRLFGLSWILVTVEDLHLTSCHTKETHLLLSSSPLSRCLRYYITYYIKAGPALRYNGRVYSIVPYPHSIVVIRIV